MVDSFGDSQNLVKKLLQKSPLNSTKCVHNCNILKVKTLVTKNSLNVSQKTQITMKNSQHV